MSGTLFGRVTMVGLLVALVVGCGQVEPGGAGEAGPGPADRVTGAPDSGAPDSGAPDSGAPDSGAPDSGAPDSGAPEPWGSNPDPGTPGPSTDEAEVAWVPPGPGSRYAPAPPYSPGHPPGRNEGEGAAARWHMAFDKHDCAAIAALGPERNQRQLYAGLGDACGAALKKNDPSWPSAEAALQHVGNVTDPLDQSALRLLRDLVVAHQRAPHATIRIVDPSPGSVTPTRGSVTPTPESVTPTRELVTPTPKLVTPTPELVTPTPESTPSQSAPPG
jgi:hypothetical protein